MVLPNWMVLPTRWVLPNWMVVAGRVTVNGWFATIPQRLADLTRCDSGPT